MAVSEAGLPSGESRRAGAGDTACLIGKVPVEVTVRPMLGYLGLLLVCLLAIAFVPEISMILPRLFGY